MIKKSLRVRGGVWAHYDGQTFFLENKKSARELSGLKGQSGGLILSPMPGKILKIQCKVGENVSEHKSLCIIEAMKMEYTVKAPFNSKIKKIYKVEGDQVQLGESLMEIEAQ